MTMPSAEGLYLFLEEIGRLHAASPVDLFLCLGAPDLCMDWKVLRLFESSC